jgi:hypothetical protein
MTPMPEPLSACGARSGRKGGADEPRRHLHEPPHRLCRRRPSAATRQEGGGRAATTARVMGALAIGVAGSGWEETTR